MSYLVKIAPRSLSDVGWFWSPGGIINRPRVEEGEEVEEVEEVEDLGVNAGGDTLK